MINRRHVIWHQDFRSEAEVVKAGGTVYGSPTFNKQGVAMDGVSDYITYSIPSTIFARSHLSLIIEFTPYFNWDLDQTVYFFRTTTGERSFFFKYANADNNDLYLYLNNGIIARSSSSAYKDYWKEGERNVFVISAESGDSSMWLNGNPIFLGDTSPMGYAYPDELYLFHYMGGSLSESTVHSFTVLDEKLTAEDAQYFYDGSEYKFDPDICLNFDGVEGLGIVSDPYTTPDSSRWGRDCLLGDGSTAATIPTSVDGGFDLDGTTDYLKVENASGLFNNDEQSFVICFSPDFTLDSGANEYILDSTGGDYRWAINSGGFLSVVLGGTSVFSVPKATLEPFWGNGKNVLVVGGKDGDTCAWFNGYRIVENDTTSWSPTDISDLFIGTKNDTSSYYSGKIHHFSTYHRKLGNLQVQYITDKLLKTGKF